MAATTVVNLNFAVIVDLRLLSPFGANPPEIIQNIETSYLYLSVENIETSYLHIFTTCNIKNFISGSGSEGAVH